MTSKHCPVNLNSASFEELRALDQIGSGRARAICTYREKVNRELTLEDLSAIHEVPQSVWSPLLEQGLVVFQEVLGGANQYADIDKILAQQNELHAKQMKEQMLRMEKQQAQMMAELRARLLDEQQVKLAELQARMTKEFQANLNNPNQYPPTFNENVTQDVRVKVAHDPNAVNRSSPAQSRLNCNQNNSNVSHTPPSHLSTATTPTTSARYVYPGGLPSNFFETRAPGGIYGSNNMHPEISRSVTQTELQKGTATLMTTEDEVSSLSQVGAPASQLERSHSNVFPESLAGSVDQHYSRSPTAGNNRRGYFSSGPSSKMTTFDGKADWRAFRLQFEEMAIMYSWVQEVKLRKLIECLRDKALIFYSGQRESVRKDYIQLRDRLERHFGRKDPPATVRRMLQGLRQLVDQSLEDFADKVYSLAQDGFPDAGEETIEIVAVEAFLRGCTDKAAALTAMNHNPTSLYAALDHVIAAIHNHRLLGAKHTSEIRRVSFGDEQDDFSKIRSIQHEEKEPNTKMMSEVTQLKKDMVELSQNVAEILKTLRTSAVSPSQNRGRSFSPSSSTRTFRCYNCNEQGHVMRECPSPSRNRSPSPSVKSSDKVGPLNC